MTTTTVRVGALADLAPGTAKRIEVDGRTVALVRIGDRSAALVAADRTRRLASAGGRRLHTPALVRLAEALPD